MLNLSTYTTYWWRQREREEEAQRQRERNEEEAQTVTNQVHGSSNTVLHVLEFIMLNTSPIGETTKYRHKTALFHMLDMAFTYLCSD